MTECGMGELIEDMAAWSFVSEAIVKKRES